MAEEDIKRVDDSEEEQIITGSMADEPQFEPITNEGLMCENCRFRLDGLGVLICRKYDMKPASVMDGGECPKFKKSLRG